MWSLVTSGGQRLPVRSLPAVLGRHKSADIVLPHPSIEPHHARLTLADDGSLFLTALEEAVVEVAGWRVDESVLIHGDELLIGTVTLRLVDDSAPALPEKPKPAAEPAHVPPGAAPKPAPKSSADELQLRRPPRPVQPARAVKPPKAIPRTPRRHAVQPLRSQRSEAKTGLLHADLSQLAGGQKALLVGGLLIVCAALVWALAVGLPKIL